MICGRYEGVDERVSSDLVDDEISIGDYVLTGGEVAAMVLMDAVTRLIPGVLGGSESACKDSFADNLLEHAHYTRPESFEGEAVPEVLLSGNHKEIEIWRRESALIRTFLSEGSARKKVIKPAVVEILESGLATLKKYPHPNLYVALTHYRCSIKTRHHCSGRNNLDLHVYPGCPEHTVCRFLCGHPA